MTTTTNPEGEVLESSVSLGIQINFCEKGGESPIVSAYVDDRHIVTFQVGVSAASSCDPGSHTARGQREFVVRQLCEFPLVKQAIIDALVTKMKEAVD